MVMFLILVGQQKPELLGPSDTVNFAEHLDTNNKYIESDILQLYGIRHMGKDYTDNERGNPQPPLHGQIFSICSKGSFICTIP